MRSQRFAALLVLGLGCGRPGQSMVPPEVEPNPAAAPSCAAAEYEDFAACVQVERIAEDVRRIARPRPPGSAGWLHVQSLCADTFAELGYEVEQHRYETGINVIGTRWGDTHPQERVVVGAHYDHIPGCDGADDNATGVAGVLEIARVLANRDAARTLVLACWDEEERGLLGSRAWVERARTRAEQVVVYFNFDAIGVRRREPGTQQVPPGFELLFPAEIAELEASQHRGDFVAIIANRPARPFAEAVAAYGQRSDLRSVVLELSAMLLATPLAIDLQRSDHASFWHADIPAVMLTDTADFRTATYHCRGAPDAFDTVEPEFVAQIVRATVGAVIDARVVQDDVADTVGNP